MGTTTNGTVSTFSPTTRSAPTRRTSEYELNEFNKQLRASPLYQQFMRSRGLPTTGRVKLSRKQQSDLERAMAGAGFSVPGGMHIDQGGNLNQKNRLVRNAAITTAIVGGTIATLGAAGAFAPAALAPAAGGATGAGAAGAAGAATGVGTGLSTVAAPVFGAAAPAIGTAGVTVPVFGGAAATGLGASTAPLIGSVAAPVIGGAAASVPVAAGGGAVVGGGGAAGGAGMTTKNWIDVGSRAADFFGNWQGNRSQNKATERASQVAEQGNAAMLALEREKLADARAQQQRADAIAERNFQIQQEERLEDLRRQEAQEIQLEPQRRARDAAYRAYMQKYYGVSVDPYVERTARSIVGPTTPAVTQPPVKKPLSEQANPASAYGVLPPPDAYTSVLPPRSDDPYMQSWQLPSSEPVQYRRAMQRGEEY